MATFEPPTAEGPQHLSRYGDNPADKLFRHFSGQETGETVWRDPDSNYHQSQYPYQGGAEYRTYNDDDVTITLDPPNDSLATALEVYPGGAISQISESQRTDLIAAGFGAGINNGPVFIDKWTTEDVAKLNRHVMSVADPNIPRDPTVVDGKAEFRLDGNLGQGNRRDFYTHSDFEGTDVVAETILDPLAYGADIGDTPTSDVLPQLGLCLRYQNNGSTHTAITINNNIFFVVPFINVGVWKANVDGTGFLARTVSTVLARDFPMGVEVDLSGNTISVRSFDITQPRPPYTDPNYALIVDLDSFGDIGAIPTPVGQGYGGLLVAHLGADSNCAGRFRKTIWRRR
jgi:hypothetical protein